MTEERMTGILMRMIMVPILLLVISFSIVGLASFVIHANESKELGDWVPVVTEDYSVNWTANRAEITATFSYEYAGVSYEGQRFSPFEELTETAGKNPGLIQELLRKDHPPITVYVNPENPEIASIAAGWGRPGYSDDLNGGILLALSLIGLYFCLRLEPRVQDLIPG